MIRLASLSIAFLTAGLLAAQNQSGFVNPAGITRTWGNVVHPAGSSALPGVQRFTPNVVYPAGGSSAIGIPGNRLNNDIGRHPGQYGNGYYGRHGSTSFIYTVPVYVGGGYIGGGYYDNSYLAPPAQPAPQQPQQPNITVIYPPPATPVVIYPSDAQGAPPQYVPPADRPTPSVYQPPAPPPPETSSYQPSGYLIAFKDHTIYSAIAYWVEGETLHYFTAGNTHNQVSVSLVDRALTERLNQDAGLELKLPPAK